MASTARVRPHQPRRATGIALLFSLAALISQAPPVGAAPNAASASGVEHTVAASVGAALVADLAGQAQPAAAFGQLSPGQRSAVVGYLSVARTTSSLRTVRSLGPAGRRGGTAAGAAGSGAGCWTWRWERDAWNLFSLKLWAYFQEIDWCDDGLSLVRDPQLLNYGVTYFPFWSWTHAGDHVWGGAGQSVFRSWTQADFSLCLAPNIGCIQNTYPWLDMTVHANGTGTGSVG